MQHNQIKKAEIRSSRIDPALWARFANVGSEEEFYRIWLALQCSLISNTIQGILVIGDPERESFAPVAKWPEEGEDPERLAEISDRVLEEHCGLLVELDMPAGYETSISSRYGMAYPILIDGDLHGVIAMEVLANSEEQLQSLMGHLQWGVAWMELLFRRRQVKQNEASMTRLKSAVDILADSISEKIFEGGSMAFVTEMARQLKCERVSLAFIRRNRARIQAISHTAQIGKRMNLTRAIEMAMDEAIVQRKEIFYPLQPNAEVLIVRDHEQLAKQHGAGSILTMPFYGDERYYGALTFERQSGQPFNEEEASFCRSIASLLFPALEIMRQNDRLLILKIWDALKGELVKFFGPRYLGRKLIIVLAVAVVIFFNFKMGDYKISADALLEGAVKRVVVAPFDGYIKNAQVRAGDVVESDMVMCTLDDRDLLLEKINWLSKRKQYQREYKEVLAEHKWAEAQIIKAQLEQAISRLNLAERHLKRTRIVSPFKGIVLSGDLSQRLGGSVAKGEVLFEVAPLDAYRVILEVDERRITDVKVGQRGQMILSAVPRNHFDFVVEKIIPLSTSKEGLNYFRVEAKLETASGRLRPGMEGIGKIRVGRRKLISIWTRSLEEWIRLWVWSWWP